MNLSADSCYPILTFDEAKLSPSLGYVFRLQWLDPYESLVSMLWKFAWMNRLPGHTVVTQVAMRTIDPYEGVAATQSELNVRHIAATLGLAQKTVRASIEYPGFHKLWWPQLRFCPRCMSRGYHGVIHQSGSSHYCAVHGCPLESHCRSCGSKSDYLINASVLDAPFKCPICRRPYGNMSASFVHRHPLHAHARTAISRAFWG